MVVGKLKPVLGALFFTVAPMVMLYPLWWHPTSAGEDDVMWFHPTRKLVGQSLRNGRWPLEGAAELGGQPLMADPQAAVMYPVTWLFAIMDTQAAYSLSIFAAFSLAGVGTYLYLRTFLALRWAALFGSIAFMFSGFMVGHRAHLSLIHAAAFLPWGLWAIEQLSRRPARALATLAPVLALTIAAGHWPTLIHMAVVWSVYLVFRSRPLGRSLVIVTGALALATLITLPQLVVTAQFLRQTTRPYIGYATAGENSFFPAAAVLAFFPMLMGSRTPNFFPQPWWGPWHLCEMLGYVGLSTLLLAGALVWARLRLKRWRAGLDPALTRLVSAWVWIALGAGVWMLGYYLPSYRLVHLLPVLGMVRCPARMLLVVDFALATLAAVCIQAVAGSGSSRLLSRCIRRAATIALPAAMFVALGLVTGLGWVLARVAPQKPGGFEFFVGWASEAIEAVQPTNPAVWVPLLLMATTIAIVLFWLARPRGRAVALVVLLVGDLFFLTRFVDMPATGGPLQDPENSPAAAWLKKEAPSASYRVWGLGRHYCDRPAELLLPRTANGMGFATLAAYDPLLNPACAHLFGFDAVGHTHQWAWLIRTNRMLSFYNVRYILAAEPEYREIIDSVRIPPARRRADGPNVLTPEWHLRRARLVDQVLCLRTPFPWSWSIAQQVVSLAPAGTYRISLDARALHGAAGFLRADLLDRKPSGQYTQFGLTVIPEQIASDWRHFERTVQTPAQASSLLFRVFTRGEREIEVRNILLRRSHPDAPLNLGQRLKPSEKVYRKVAELSAVDGRSPPVAVYENLLCSPEARVSETAMTPQEIEAFKWQDSSRTDTVIPRLAVRAELPPRPLLLLGTLGGLATYGALALLLGLRERRRAPHEGTR